MIRSEDMRQQDAEQTKREKAHDLSSSFIFFQDVEQTMSKEEEKQVMIEKAINMRLMCDYVVSCSYGDLVLIICMLRDYVKMLDEVRDDVDWKYYYRNRFMKMANKFSEQIEYDYDAALEKCRKKLAKQESSSDVGEEALELAVKRGKGKGKCKKGGDQNE